MAIAEEDKKTIAQEVYDLILNGTDQSIDYGSSDSPMPVPETPEERSKYFLGIIKDDGVKAEAGNMNLDAIFMSFGAEAKKELDEYVDDTSKSTIDSYVEGTTKPRIDSYVDNTVKPDINDYVDGKEQSLDTYTSEKKNQLDTYTDEKVKEADTSLTEKCNSLIESFDKNATEKKTEYDNNHSSKLKSYDANAEQKINEYNSNHSNSMKTYDSNAESKLNAYNENHSEKMNAWTEKVSADNSAWDAKVDDDTEILNQIKTAVETSEKNVKSSEENAKSSADTASKKATEASASATNAKASETNAKTSETNAAKSASSAKASEENAKSSADTASKKATEASTSATNAKTSETNASKSATDAEQAKIDMQAALAHIQEMYDAYILDKKRGGMKVGVSYAWLGKSDTIPERAMICDGRALDKDDPEYAELYAIIGTTYGESDDGTQFLIPNYIDCIDQNGDIDPEVEGVFLRATANDDEVGKKEFDAIRDINGAISGASSNNTYLTRGKGCISYDKNKHSGNGMGGFGDWNSYYYHVFDANANNNSWGNPMAGHANGNDIHPYSVRVLYLIVY